MNATKGEAATVYVLEPVTERKVEASMRYVAFQNHCNHRVGFGGLRRHGVNFLVPNFQFDHDFQRAFSQIRIGAYNDESPPG